MRLVHTLALLASILAIGISLQVSSRGLAGATPNVLTLALPLEAGELFWDTATGGLTGARDLDIVIGTLLPGERGRVHVLQKRDANYARVWSFTHEAAMFSSAIIRDLNSDGREELITLWLSGQGGYLDIRIFRWINGSFHQAWQLPQHGRQLTQGAHVSTRRIDAVGGVELVIRAPHERPGDSTLGALPHQVSLYRWDPRKNTLLLARRFIDPQRAFQ